MKLTEKEKRIQKNLLKRKKRGLKSAKRYRKLTALNSEKPWEV